jgi:hypothetical protein
LRRQGCRGLCLRDDLDSGGKQGRSADMIGVFVAIDEVPNGFVGDLADGGDLPLPHGWQRVNANDPIPRDQEHGVVGAIGYPIETALDLFHFVAPAGGNLCEHRGCPNQKSHHESHRLTGAGRRTRSAEAIDANGELRQKSNS